MAANETAEPAGDGAPRFLTVEEMAVALRIGRTTAYALVKQWLATSGREGIPVVRLGRSLRVPSAALDRLADPAPTAGE